MVHQRRFVGAFVYVGLAVSLVGCDYWPPTLQDEIEQLRAEIQTLTMEKAQLQAQVVDLAKMKQEPAHQVLVIANPDRRPRLPVGHPVKQPIVERKEHQGGGRRQPQRRDVEGLDSQIKPVPQLVREL